ncbi:hypothetical protein DFH08DRAFT_812943 [Mycena albidolilacea]|uniref:Uncharacterized protein n=1 Tax=Mycena albidolilacea TaxID=1033008 RepID=A0AAD7ELT4_9AGAR|nr:hypothetical protein DFH08DRAFT_812943 [Mycena albidolilacea]
MPLQNIKTRSWIINLASTVYSDLLRHIAVPPATSISGRHGTYFNPAPSSTALGKGCQCDYEGLGQSGCLALESSSPHQVEMSFGKSAYFNATEFAGPAVRAG